ncbi:MAG: hypothetical protein AB7P76_03735 [Candidatus Melainabacteria bacterium]
MIPSLVHPALPVSFAARKRQVAGQQVLDFPEGDAVFRQTYWFPRPLPRLTRKENALLGGLRADAIARRKKAGEPLTLTGRLTRGKQRPRQDVSRALYLHNLWEAEKAFADGRDSEGVAHVGWAAEEARAGMLWKEPELKEIFPRRHLAINPPNGKRAKARDEKPVVMTRPVNGTMPVPSRVDWALVDPGSLRYGLHAGLHAPNTPRNLLRTYSQMNMEGDATQDPRYLEQAALLLEEYKQSVSEDPAVIRMIELVRDKIPKSPAH